MSSDQSQASNTTEIVEELIDGLTEHKELLELTMREHMTEVRFDSQDHVERAISMTSEFNSMGMSEIGSFLVEEAQKAKSLTQQLEMQWGNNLKATQDALDMLKTQQIRTNDTESSSAR